MAVVRSNRCVVHSNESGGRNFAIESTRFDYKNYGTSSCTSYDCDCVFVHLEETIFKVELNKRRLLVYFQFKMNYYWIPVRMHVPLIL